MKKRMSKQLNVRQNLLKIAETVTFTRDTENNEKSCSNAKNNQALDLPGKI